MLQRIQVSDDVTIVFSFEELGYADVVATFDDAKWIDVVTYHLSRTEVELFKAIRNAATIDLPLVTNLPNHWKDYWGPGPKKKFRDELAAYRSLLVPDRVGALESFFNVSNHSKIVMTDKLAYIGSSNFASTSAKHYECGVLLRSPEVIESIRAEIVDYLVERSAPRDLSDIGKAKLAIQDIRNQLKRLLLSLAEGFMHELDAVGTSKRLWRWDDAEVSKEELEEFCALLDNWEELHSEYRQHGQLNVIPPIIGGALLEEMRALVCYRDAPLCRLAEFDFELAAQRHFQEYVGRAYRPFQRNSKWGRRGGAESVN